MKKSGIPVFIVKTFFVTLLIVAVALPAGWFTVAVGADQNLTIIGGSMVTSSDTTPVEYIYYTMTSRELFVYTQDPTVYLHQVDDNTIALGTNVNPYNPRPITEGNIITSSNVAVDETTAMITSSDVALVNTPVYKSGIDFGCNNGELVSAGYGQCALITLSPQAKEGGIALVTDSNILINAAQDTVGDLIKSATPANTGYEEFVKRLEQIAVEESEAETEKNGGNRKAVEPKTEAPEQEEASGGATTGQPEILE